MLLAVLPLCAAGCTGGAGPEGGDIKGEVAADQGTTLRVAVTLDGDSIDVPITIFSDLSAIYDPARPPLLRPTSGETVAVEAGELRAFVGDQPDETGLSGGLPLWLDPAGGAWISPSSLLNVHPNTHHEVTFALNQRAEGAWVCEGAGTRARIDGLRYDAGAFTTLPGVGPVRVEGRRILAEDSVHTVHGMFIDPRHAELTEAIPGRSPRAWRCCAEAHCEGQDTGLSAGEDSATPPAP